MSRDLQEQVRATDRALMMRNLDRYAELRKGIERDEPAPDEPDPNYVDASTFPHLAEAKRDQLAEEQRKAREVLTTGWRTREFMLPDEIERGDAELAAELKARGSDVDFKSRLAVETTGGRRPLLVFDFPTNENPVAVAQRAAPIAVALELLLDESKNPETKIARLQREQSEAAKQQAVQHAERQRLLLESEKRQRAAAVEAAKLATYAKISPVGRAILQTALASSAAQRPMLLDLFRSIETEPATPTTLPAKYAELMALIG